MRTLPLALVISLAVAALAYPVPRQEEASPLRGQVTELTLANGWHFILVYRNGPPVVTIETAIDVGSVEDPQGQRGLANLLAQLMVRGSERLGSTDWAAERVALAALEEVHRQWLAASEGGDADEMAKAYGAFLVARDQARSFGADESFLRVLEDAGSGSTLEIETTPDWTRFAVTLPSNQIERWCWLEAERFTRPCLRGFFGERDRLVEARRRTLWADPMDALLGQLRLAAVTTHPYRHPVEGYVDDLLKLERAAAENFFRRHYGASRLVTTIVGDFDVDSVRKLLERYLASVPANPDSTRDEADAPEDPEPTFERGIVVAYPAPPRMALAWSAPPFAHTDSPAVEVTARILGPGPGSRLYERLVRGGLALDVDLRVGWPGRRSDNLVLVTLTPVAGIDPDAVVAAIADELDALRTDGPSATELGAARTMLRAEREIAVEDPRELARLLNEQHLLAGDWSGALERVAEWDAVRAEAVQAIVDVYFTDVRRTVAVLVPDEDAPEAQGTVPGGPGRAAGAPGARGATSDEPDANGKGEER